MFETCPLHPAEKIKSLQFIGFEGFFCSKLLSAIYDIACNQFIFMGEECSKC